MSAKQVSISLPCPVCQGPMIVRELECQECEITVRGNFGKVDAGVINAGVSAVPAAITGGAANYGALTTEQAQFMETFLRCRGIIRDVEATLGISYPTVRARLDGMLATLGLTESSVRAVPCASSSAHFCSAGPESVGKRHFVTTRLGIARRAGGFGRSARRKSQHRQRRRFQFQRLLSSSLTQDATTLRYLSYFRRID